MIMKIAYAAICVMAVVVLSEPQLTQAVTCNPLELSSCFAAITLPAAPSTTCCTKLKEQETCLCGYIKDPNLSQYVNSPNAKKVASACEVPFPTC